MSRSISEGTGMPETALALLRKIKVRKGDGGSLKEERVQKG